MRDGDSPFPLWGGDFIANKILPTGYELQVQTDMGVTSSVLSDAEIQSKAMLAEAYTIKAVSTYATIIADAEAEGATDDEVNALTFLQAACIAQVCALLCPGMPNRVKLSETSETGYSYKLQVINWNRKRMEFERAIWDYVNLATGGTATYFSPLGVVTNERLEV